MSDPVLVVAGGWPGPRCYLGEPVGIVICVADVVLEGSNPVHFVRGLEGHTIDAVSMVL
jgi:hypothetical protein